MSSCVKRETIAKDSNEHGIRRNERRNYIANQYRIFSITYGSFFCLTGIVLTTVEPFKACKNSYIFEIYNF